MTAAPDPIPLATDAAPAGPAGWRGEVEALLGRREVAAGGGDPRAAAAAWTRAAARPHATVVRREEEVPARASQLVLPATLVDAPDAVVLLAAVADALGTDGELVAAVPWCRPLADARRSLHPGSLLGLLVDRFAVDELAAEDGVLGVRAHVERDEHLRHRAASAALLGAQAAVERHLDLWSRSSGVTAALEDADVRSLDAVAAVDAQLRAARRRREDALQALELEREQQAAQVDDLQAAVERLTAHRDAARVHAAAAERRAEAATARLERMTASSWWQIRGVLLAARGRPGSWLRVPVRILRIARGRT